MRILADFFFHYPVAELSRNCQKVHLHITIVHLSLYPSLFDLPFKSSCPYKLIFGKTVFCFTFWSYSANFRLPKLTETVKSHLYTPRPFIGTYSHVATTIRYKDTAWKSSDKRILPILHDRQTDGHPKSISPQPLGSGPNYTCT